MSTKENIYDEELSPLMSQVAAICQKYGIEMLATFRIPSLDDENLAWIGIEYLRRFDPAV